MALLFRAGLTLRRGAIRLAEPSRLATAALASPRPSVMAAAAAAANTTTTTAAAAARPFSCSRQLPRKRRQNFEGTADPPGVDAQPPSATPRELTHLAPLDKEPILAAFWETDAKFKPQLRAVVGSGSFDPAVIGALPVLVKPPAADGHGDAAPREFPLRELAQVVSRSGRLVSLLVNDRDYVKPIISAVLRSPDFNQQPQQHATNELELTLRVEMHRREDLLSQMRNVSQAWRDAIRKDRSKFDKMLKTWRKNGLILPDVCKRGEKELQSLQDKKMMQIDDEENKCTRQLSE